MAEDKSEPRLFKDHVDCPYCGRSNLAGLPLEENGEPIEEEIPWMCMGCSEMFTIQFVQYLVAVA